MMFNFILHCICVITFDFFVQGEWEEALAAMDKAVSDMPRTKHRL